MMRNNTYKRNILKNKRGDLTGTVILVIVLIIVIAIASMFIKLNWQRFKAEASFGFTVAALVIFVIAILVLIIRIKIRKAKKEKERKAREEAERREAERLEKERLERERLERVAAGLEEPVPDSGYLGDGKLEMSDIKEAAGIVGDKISGVLNKKKDQ